MDTDLDADLMQQFSCLGTTDRDVLISHFQKLVGSEMNDKGCAFFLEMNSWNLQAAICSYYEYVCPKEDLPKMSLIKDVTIGEGEEIPPNTKFLKTWKIENSGDGTWPSGCCLRFYTGDKMGHVDRVYVGTLKSHETTDISLEMISPESPGIYQGQWRMSTSAGHFFGDIIWVIITVAEGGLLGLTQQMDAFHQLGSNPQGLASSNPFATTLPPTSAHLQIHEMHPSISHIHQNSLPSSPHRNHQFEHSEFLHNNPDIFHDINKSEPTAEEMIS